MASGATAMQPSVGGKSGPAMCRKMALPAPFSGWAQVVVQNHDHVVEAVAAPQAFVAAGIGQAHRAVVAAVGGIVAPAVVGPERPGGEGGGRRGQAVGAPQDGDRVPVSPRRGAVALAFPAGDARAAERTGHRQAAGAEKAAVAGTAGGGDDDVRQSGSSGCPHGRKTAIFGKVLTRFGLPPATCAAGGKRSTP